jgi:fucose permease
MPHSPRKLLYIGFFGFIMVGMPNAALGVAWAQMQATFGVSLDALGILLGTITFGRLTLSLYSGRVIGWMGLGNYMLLGSIVMVFSLLGYALVPTWELLVLVALVYGFGVTALNTGINAHAAAHYTSGPMNWLHAFYGLGSALGPLVVTVIAVQLGLAWQWSYGVFVVIQVLLTIIFALTRQNWRLGEVSATPTERPKVPLRSSLGVAGVWFGMILFFLHGGIQIGTGQLTNSLMIDSRNIDPATAGFWVSLYWAGLTAGRMFTGLVVERIGNDRFMRVNMLVTVIGTLLLWSNLGDMFTYAGIALIGFTLGPVLPTLFADTNKRVGLRHIANAVGLQIAASGLGLALLPGLAAWVAERAGLETIGAYLFLLALLSFLVHEGLLLHDRHEQRTVTAQAVAGD